VNSVLLAALAEPNRLRIIELLDAAPRSVGEIAAALGLRQPQTTKHLQTLERAGVVAMHPLGQRRIYALRREPLGELRDWLDGLAREHPSAAVLADYQRAVETETALARRDPAWAVGRVFRFVRELPAAPGEVWSYWTRAERVAAWWSPEHFTVATCELDPVGGGRLRIVMEEADGTRHDSTGRFLRVREPERLEFELAPLSADGRPLFSADHDVSLRGANAHTRLVLEIRITTSRPEAASAIAGIELGWGQLLDQLSRVLS
jgi:uncharacterized protein YndB with AHSA1/START domain/DNA-binding transcriptional ArsR family regulator